LEALAFRLHIFGCKPPELPEETLI